MDNRVSLIENKTEYILKNPSNIGFEYHIYSVLGFGGSALVYRAYYVIDGMRSNVIIKELFPMELSEKNYLVRTEDGLVAVNPCLSEDEKNKGNKFFNEYKKIAKREQETVKKVCLSADGHTSEPYFFGQLDQFESNGTLYSILLSEEGETLEELINSKENANNLNVLCDVNEILEYGLRILEALEPVHRRKYLHLDISPDNIHVSKIAVNGLRVVRLIDFNSMFDLSGMSGEEPCFSFKEGYSAYELSSADGNNSMTRFSFASDLFSVAAVIFRLLKGYTVNDVHIERVNSWKITTNEKLFSKISDSVIDEINVMLRKGLSLSPKRRFQSIEEFKSTIRNIIDLNNKNRYYLKNKINTANVADSFFGRVDEINTIQHYIETGHYAVIQGIGGIGKSFLASRFAYLHRDKYDTIMILKCNSTWKELIIDDKEFPVIGLSRQSNESDDEYYARKIDVVRRITDNRTLLVFDNVNNIDDVDFNDIVSNSFDSIITTRCDLKSLLDNTVVVEELGDEEAIDLFRCYYKKDTRINTCLKVIRAVKRHTMTIELIARHLQATGKIPEDMIDPLDKLSLQEYDSEKFRTIKDGTVANGSVYQQIKYILNISGLVRNERKLLYLLSLFPVSGIYREVFAKIAGAPFDAELSDLNFLGWISFGNDEKIYVHPLIADVANCERIESNEKLVQERENLNLVLCATDDCLRKFVLLKTEIGEAFLKKYDFSNDLFAAKVFANVGNLYRLNNRFEKSIIYLNKAIDIYMSIDDYDLTYPVALNNIALSFQRTRRYDEALEAYKSALTLLKILGKDQTAKRLEATIISNQGEVYQCKSDYDNALNKRFSALEILYSMPDCELETALIKQSIGNTYVQKTSYDEAIKYLFESFEIYDRFLGVSNKITLSVMTSISTVFLRKGKCDEAIKGFKDVLSVLDDLGADEVEKVIIYKRLGEAYWRKKYYELAEKYFIIARDIERSAGMSSLIGTINNLGIVYQEQNKVEDAISCFKFVVNQMSKTNDIETVSTALGNMALLYNQNDEYEEALSLCKESYNVFKVGNHPITVSIALLLNNMGYVYCSLKEYDNAINCYLKSLEIRRRLQCMKTLDVAATHQNLGLAYYYSGLQVNEESNQRSKYKLARDQFLKSAYLRESMLEDNDILIADCYQSAAIACDKLKQYDISVQYAIKDIKIRKASKTKDEMALAASYSNLGFTFVTLKKYDDAISLFEKSLQLRNKNAKTDPVICAIIYHSIGDAYTGLGNKDEATKYYRQSEAMASNT